MELKPLPGDPDESKLRRWGRRLGILTGLAAVVLGIVLAIQFMQTPAIALEPPISEYAATHSASEPQPTGPRTGLWVEIPALKIALPIREGDGSNNIPDWVALHYPGTAAPGSAGNSYLYAHGIRGMFGTLLFAKRGELVLLHNYTTKLVQAFHISNVVGRTRWNDVSWLKETSGTPLLTMQTCVGADINTDRWIVQATP